MASKCTKKWLSIRTLVGVLTKKEHFLVTEDTAGNLTGKQLEIPLDVKVTCRDDGMTLEVPATGPLQLKYEGLFDGDKFPPGIYELKEDHITGTCTLILFDRGKEQILAVSEEWVAEKTT